MPLDPSSLLTGGATNLDRLVGPEYLGQLREAYNDAIIEVSILLKHPMQVNVRKANAGSPLQAFYAAVATAALSLAGSVFMPWFSVKKVKKQRDEAKAAAAEAPEEKVNGTSPGAGEVAATKTEAA